MKNRFLSLSPWEKGASLLLDPDESHHLLKVFRAEIGDELQLVNGKGGLAEARLISIKKNIAEVQIESISQTHQTAGVNLIFAISKGQALDSLIHSCAQLGVRSFQPLVTAHSLSKSGWNAERWQKVILEVSKQCQETFFPVIYPPASLPEWLKARTPKPLLVCLETDRQKTQLPSSDKELDVLVGAEGGWSKEEEDLLRSHSDFVSLGLGKNRLRAETAAMTALILAKQSKGEL